MIDPLLESTAKVKARADAKAAMLDQYQQNRQALETADKTVALGVSRLGNIEMPVESESRAVEFNRMIDDVLSRQDLGDRSSTSRTVPLGNNSTLAGVIDASLKVDRLVTELQLTGQPEAIAQIIAELESNPLVTLGDLQTQATRVPRRRQRAVRQARIAIRVIPRADQRTQSARDTGSAFKGRPGSRGRRS